MVDENSSGNEINSNTTVSLNLCGASVAFGDSESDNHSTASEEDDSHSNSLQLSHSTFPTSTNINVENSSDVIIGPVTQFHGPVTIYQNTHNNKSLPSNSFKYLTDGSTDRNVVSSTANSSAKLVASESLSGKPIGNIPFSRKKVTVISILVFVVIILITVIISYVVGLYISNENNKDPFLDDIKETENPPGDKPQIPGSRHKLIYRNIWGGRPPLYERPAKLPMKYVIISHTAGTECDSIPTCSKQMQQIQSLHVTSGSPDIGYNFLIGGDENIYVARGWDNHNFHMNLDTIGICFIGNYIYSTLTPGMIEATHQLLKMGVDNGKLDKDYILVAHNQTYNTQSPGPNVYKQIKFWPHFSSKVLQDIPDE